VRSCHGSGGSIDQFVLLSLPSPLFTGQLTTVRVYVRLVCGRPAIPRGFVSIVNLTIAAGVVEVGSPIARFVSATTCNSWTVLFRAWLARGVDASRFPKTLGFACANRHLGLPIVVQTNISV